MEQLANNIISENNFPTDASKNEEFKKNVQKMIQRFNAYSDFPEEIKTVDELLNVMKGVNFFVNELKLWDVSRIDSSSSDETRERTIRCFKKLYKSESYQKQIATSTFTFLDQDHTGVVTKGNFVLYALICLNGDLTPMNKMIFRQFDVDHSGELDEKEIEQLMIKSISSMMEASLLFTEECTMDEVERKLKQDGESFNKSYSNDVIKMTKLYIKGLCREMSKQSAKIAHKVIELSGAPADSTCINLDQFLYFKDPKNHDQFISFIEKEIIPCINIDAIGREMEAEERKLRSPFIIQ